MLLAIHIAEDVAQPVAHRQFVWTIPKRLRIFFRFHRHLLDRLPNLAWQTVCEVYRAVLGRNDVVPGAIITIQTFGQLIHFHPHLHGLLTDGAFTADGQFIRLPQIENEPFLRLWQQRVFGLLLDEGKIEPQLVEQMRAWRHSGFAVDRSVRLEAGDRAGIQRLVEYMARCPFSLARLVRITDSGKVLYRAEKTHCHRFPKAASKDLFGGALRNFQLFEPLDFLAELTQHIPNTRKHLIRYYGFYANKNRGIRAAAAAAQAHAPTPDTATPTADQARRHWAALIKRVFQTDPLRCPQCKGQMKIISFIQAHQQQLIERILRHCQLWPEPARAPPPGQAPFANVRVTEPGLELDGEFLEHQRCEQLEFATPA